MNYKIFKGMGNYLKILNDNGIRIEDISFVESSGVVLFKLNSAQPVVISSVDGSPDESTDESVNDSPDFFLTDIDFKDDCVIVTDEEDISHVVEFICNASTERPITFRGSKAESPFFQVVGAIKQKTADVTDLSSFRR